MAACHQVFNTHELVEAILVNLSGFQLGAALQVCETWRDVIKQSHTIATPTTISPATRTSEDDEPPTYSLDTDIAYHPATVELKRTMSVRGGASGRAFDNAKTIINAKFFLNAFLEVSRAEFLTYPPIRDVQVDLSHLPDGRKHHVSVSQGVRVGDVVKLMRATAPSTKAIPDYAYIRVQEHAECHLTFELDTSSGGLHRTPYFKIPDRYEESDEEEVEA